MLSLIQMLVTKSSYVSLGSSLLLMLLFGFYIFNYIKTKTTRLN